MISDFRAGTKISLAVLAFIAAGAIAMTDAAADSSQPQPVYPEGSPLKTQQGAKAQTSRSGIQPAGQATPSSQENGASATNAPEQAPQQAPGAGADENAAQQQGQTTTYQPEPESQPESKTAVANGGDIESLSKDPAQWPTAAKNYASTRYSKLDEINSDNVGKLQAAWMFSLGTIAGQEAAPLVIDNVMYVIGPYPNEVFALDATTGDLKWSYKPKPNPSAQGVACCDVVSRGLAYDHGKIFIATLDDHAVALDATTGRELWHTKLGDINTGETVTMAPLAAKGKVFIGNSGGEMGVRGWMTALDQNTGEIVWRGYSTGPDNEVLIGDDFKPFYDSEKGKDLGVSSWPLDHWKIGGGGPWGWVSYDPELNTIYYGSGNPGPWNSNQRPGDNKWTTTIFARDADTGHVKWAYQINPHDLWDYDEINENILLDLDIDGHARKTLVHIGRNGFMYVIDRQTGEVISADPYDTVTSIEKIDLKTGRPILNENMKPDVNTVVRDVCPASPGAKDWQPSAWSPQTKLLYVPHQHLCMNYKTAQVGYIAGTPFVGATVDMYAGPGGYRGEYMAWDPVQKKKVWSIHENFPVWSGTLVTAGNVAFYGTMDRWLKAVDAKTGKLLWKFRAGSGFIGQPITYKGSDGRQYIAILDGVGGWSGAIAHADIDPRARNGALGFTGANQDLPAYTKGGAELLVFAIPKQPNVQASAVQLGKTTMAHAIFYRLLVTGVGVGALLTLGAATDVAPNNKGSGEAPTAQSLLDVPVTHIVPGNIEVKPDIKSPVAGDTGAATRGMKYFDAFNCSGCHAANGAGGMGPALSNHSFKFGSDPANIYLTIVQGRPTGMPAWGTILPSGVIWDLVAYVESISDAPVSEWGTTTSLDAMKIEQVPAEFQSTPNPWQYTEPFSFGQKPTAEVKSGTNTQ